MHRDSSHPPAYVRTALKVKSHWVSSFQSRTVQDSAPSPTSNSRVVNVIFSYSSRAAIRAFACHGPRPPSRASVRLRQTPIFHELAQMNVRITAKETYRWPNFDDLDLSSQTNTSTSPHWQWPLDANAHPAHINDPRPHLASALTGTRPRRTTALSTCGSPRRRKCSLD